MGHFPGEFTTQFTVQVMGKSRDSEVPCRPPGPSTKHRNRAPSPQGPLRLCKEDQGHVGEGKWHTLPVSDGEKEVSSHTPECTHNLPERREQRAQCLWCLPSQSELTRKETGRQGGNGGSGVHLK